jgi:aspartate aminotransferase-like enzyme
MPPKMRLLTPGPTPLPEEVRLTLAMDMVHHRKPGFKALLGEIQAGLKVLFGTAQPVLPLASSGTGAMAAAVTNLFAPKEKVLIVEAGKFGQRWGEIASSHNLDATILGVPWGQAVEPAKIEEVLDGNHDLKGVFIQASETSTGVLHPIQEIAKITRERDVMLVVDGISAVGISPLPMDEWGVDCLLTGSQKGLMLPPGLALIALSEGAWKRVEEVKPAAFYFNLLGERDKTLQSSTLFTPAVSLLSGLHTSLALFQEQGMDAVYRLQWAMTQAARAGAEAMGLELLAKTHYTWGLTSIRMPEGVDGQKVTAVAADRYGVILAGGQEGLKGKIVRLGHMGHVDFGDVLAGLYALRQAVHLCGGYSASRDYLESAMAAYEEALAADEIGESFS